MSKKPSRFIPTSYNRTPAQPNPVWVAVYAKQHDLSVEVAIEHLAVHLERLGKEIADASKALASGEPDLITQITKLCEIYKIEEDQWGEIPLVDVLAKPSGKKKQR